MMPKNVQAKDQRSVDVRVMEYPHRIVIAARAFMETDYSAADIQAELGLSDDETELARDVARSSVVQRRPRG